MLKTIRELGVKLSLLWDKKAAQEADTAIGKLATGMKGIGAQAAAAAATMFGFAEATASNGQELSLYSQTLGISSERIQELGYAAKVAANVSRDELVGALEGVSSTLDNVRKGNVDAALSFNRLGLSTDVITNRNLKADQVMMMVAERLKGIQDPIARAAIANEIFGASGAKMLPLLMKGAGGIAALGGEARKMGVVFSDQAIKKQAAFQQQLNRTMEVVKNVGLRIGDALLPVVGNVLNDFSRWISVNRKLVQESLAGFIKGATILVPILFKVAVGVVNAFMAVTKFVGGAERMAKILVGLFVFAKFIPMAMSFFKILFYGWQVVAKLSGVFRVLSVAFSVFRSAILGLRMMAFIEGFTTLAAVLNPIGLVIAGVGVAIAGLIYYFRDTAWMKSFLSGVENYFVKAWMWIKETVVSAGEAVGGFVEKLGQITGVSSAISKVASFLGFNSAAPAGATAPAAVAAGGANTQNNVQAQINVSVPPGTSAKDATQIVSQGTEDGMAKALRPARNQALGGAAY